MAIHLHVRSSREEDSIKHTVGDASQTVRAENCITVTLRYLPFSINPVHMEGRDEMLRLKGQHMARMTHGTLCGSGIVGIESTVHSIEGQHTVL